jgi:RNase adaptor protein for sRNA GlmZ degradation
VIVPGFGYSYVIDESDDPTVLRIRFVPNPRLAGAASAELSGAQARWDDGELIVETFEF